MSDISLTSVLPFKTSEIINDMAKVQQKNVMTKSFGNKS
jgi:hypothetical protein